MRHPRFAPSPEQTATIRRMAKEGHGYYTILQAIGSRSYTSLKRWADANGVEINNAAAVRQWSTEELALLRRMASQGATLEELCEALPLRNETAIVRRLQRYDLMPTKVQAVHPKRFQFGEPIFGGFGVMHHRSDALPPGHPDTWALLLANSPSIAHAAYEPNRWV